MTVFAPTRPAVPHFYRYQNAEHLDRLKTIMLTHVLYLPSVGQLNDPVDCRPKIAPMSDEQMVTFLRNDCIRRHSVLALNELQKEELKIRTSIRIQGLEWFQRELSKLLNAQIEEFRIYSLSKRFNNFSLWAKYAADHTGYCLEFANEGLLFEKAVEVIYGEYAAFDLNDANRRDAIFLVHKRPEWSNEEEVRLILPRGKGSTVKMNDPRWLTRVILGMRTSDAHEQQIRGWAKERKPELTVVRATFDELHQELRLV